MFMVVVYLLKVNVFHVTSTFSAVVTLVRKVHVASLEIRRSSENGFNNMLKFMASKNNVASINFAATFEINNFWQC